MIMIQINAPKPQRGVRFVLAIYLMIWERVGHELFGDGEEWHDTLDERTDELPGVLLDEPRAPRVCVWMVSVKAE
jgi:hypothetical protein